MFTLSFLLLISTWIFFWISIRFCAGSYQNINILNIFFIYFSLNTLLAYTYNFFMYEGTNFYIESQTLWLISISFVFISVGIFLSSLLPNSIKMTSPIFALHFSPYRLLLLSLPFILLGLYYFYSTQAYMALAYALEGDIIKAVEARTGSTNALARNSGLFSLPFIYIFPAISLICLIEYIKRHKAGVVKNKLLLLSMVIFFFLLSSIYSIVLIQKYYIVQLFLYLFIGFSIIKEFKISYKYLLILFFIAVLGISFLWIFYMGGMREDFSESFNAPLWVLERIFFTNIEGLKYYVEYSNDYPLLLGQSFPNPGHVLPYDPVSITKIISQEYIMTSSQVSAGLVGSHPTIYLGEIFVNFGYIGCAFSSIFLGFFLGFFNNILDFVIKDTNRTGSFFIALYTIIAVNSLEIATGSIFIFLSYLFLLNEFIWVTIVLLLISCRFFYKKRELL